MNYKTNSSDFSMLMGTSCNGQNLESHQQQPKLENFLGRHSFANHEQSSYSNNSTTADYMYPSCLSKATNSNGTTGNNNNSIIGLSMIKTWLRNQPPAQAQNDGGASGSINNNNGNTTSSSQTLSLSMSTGSQSSSTLPLLTTSTAQAAETCSTSVDNKQLPSKTTTTTNNNGAIEAVPRKSIDTFGQRTSIYRGVTRFSLFILCGLYIINFFSLFIKLECFLVLY